MKIPFVQVYVLGWLFIFFSVSITNAQSVVNSVHNLSVNGPGTVKASSETEVCIFCHTPHSSIPNSPLWNRQDPGQTYTLYSSSTIQAQPGQPDGSSILCLSCHDGTIALGNVLNRESDIIFEGGTTVMPSGYSNLGQDLTDDHPVSFVYNSALASSDGELLDPSTLPQHIKLEIEKLQCTACHNPHDNLLGNFLNNTNQYSELCLFCHQKSGWDATSHQSSTAGWNGSGTNPWLNNSYTTVAENACENCHATHTSGSNARLTKYNNEEDNCLNCHNGNVAQEDIQSDFIKTYRHDVYAYNGIHDPVEASPVQVQHVECEDCHNPHQANNSTAVAPYASGRLSGVKGIDSDGNPVSNITFTYELCYNCHADSPTKPASPTTRQIEQNNVRLEFAADGPSFHPVEVAGQNQDVPSLVSPYSESSIIYCSDCHASDNSSANGPHGSIYPHILKYNYETADYTVESYQAYELCYQCHDRDAIINDTSTDFGRYVHQLHIVDERTPCNVCHDPHGISISQGNSTNNAHLINFDISIVQESSGAFGRLEFIDNGSFAGQCYLYCHNRNHAPRTYN